MPYDNDITHGAVILHKGYKRCMHVHKRTHGIKCKRDSIIGIELRIQKIQLRVQNNGLTSIQNNYYTISKLKKS